MQTRHYIIIFSTVRTDSSCCWLGPWCALIVVRLPSIKSIMPLIMTSLNANRTCNAAIKSARWSWVLYFVSDKTLLLWCVAKRKKKKSSKPFSARSSSSEEQTGSSMFLNPGFSEIWQGNKQFLMQQGRFKSYFGDTFPHSNACLYPNTYRVQTKMEINKNYVNDIFIFKCFSAALII